MKQLYFLAWFLVVFAALVSFLTGNFGAVTLVAFSLIALGLVYGLALWSVITNTRDINLKIFSANDES